MVTKSLGLTAAGRAWYSLFLSQVSKCYCHPHMLHGRARQAEEKYLCEKGMQRETLITSDVLSVLSFDPLIVCLTSIPALAFMATHTTSRSVVTVKWLWRSLTHLLRWTCSVHCLWWGWGGNLGLPSCQLLSLGFLCVREVPACRGFQSNQGWRTVLSSWMSAPRTGLSRMSSRSVLPKVSMRYSSFCVPCASWKGERGVQVLYRGSWTLIFY